MLVVNVLLFHTLRFYWQEKDKKLFYKRIAGIGLLLLLPIIISLGIYSRYTEVGKPIEVVVLQPNIDPYEEKYSLTNEETITLLQELAEKKKLLHRPTLYSTPETGNLARCIPFGRYLPRKRSGQYASSIGEISPTELGYGSGDLSSTYR